MPNGKEIYCVDKSTADYCYDEIYKEKIYLKRGIEINNGDVIFDIGANIGLFSLYINEIFENLQIHAFEPVPVTFEALQKNLGNFSNIKLINQGLGEKDEEVDIIFYPNNSGVSSPRRMDVDYRFEVIEKNWEEIMATYRPKLKNLPKFLRKFLMRIMAKPLLKTETIKCKLSNLSKYIRENSIEHINLMKIDAENYEREVLRGLDEEDWNKIQQIAMEVHTRFEGEQFELSEMISLLEDKGFDVSEGDESFDTMCGVYMLYGKRKN
ncbi:MAG: FkbM family methyltransferase [Candidatus Hodarchaeota archaeon]